MENNPDNNQPSKKGVRSDLERFLEFSLGMENYAVPLLVVREVIAVPNTTYVPNTPQYFVGIMNLRGQVISIIDLRKKIGVPPREDNSETAVVILDLHSVTIGAIVDSINRVIAIHPDDVSKSPAGIANKGLKTHHVSGIYRDTDSMTVMMDISKVLDLGELPDLKSA